MGFSMITIINYGLGNLNSVANMIHHVGGKCRITHSPEEIAGAEKLILPGVGAFDRGMEALQESGILKALTAAVMERQVPLLGICLGMQLLTQKSEEGHLPGLGWIPGEVRKFRFSPETGLKIPHMGWNTISVKPSNSLLAPEEEQRFYFVHSYHVVCTEEKDVIATCNYGYDFVAAFARHNIFGVQFHPEKSHRFGMAVIRRFLEIETC